MGHNKGLGFIVREWGTAVLEDWKQEETPCGSFPRATVRLFEEHSVWGWTEQAVQLVEHFCDRQEDVGDLGHSSGVANGETWSNLHIL